MHILHNDLIRLGLTLQNKSNTLNRDCLQQGTSSHTAATGIFPNICSKHQVSGDNLALPVVTTAVSINTNKVYILDYPHALFGISIDFTACVPVVNQFQHNFKIHPVLQTVFSPAVTDSIIWLMGDADSSDNTLVFYLFRPTAIT
jgi:hypothetical protein